MLPVMHRSLYNANRFASPVPHMMPLSFLLPFPAPTRRYDSGPTLLQKRPRATVISSAASFICVGIFAAHLDGHRSACPSSLRRGDAQVGGADDRLAGRRPSSAVLEPPTAVAEGRAAGRAGHGGLHIQPSEGGRAGGSAEGEAHLALRGLRGGRGRGSPGCTEH